MRATCCLSAFDGYLGGALIALNSRNNTSSWATIDREMDGTPQCGNIRSIGAKFRKTSAGEEQHESNSWFRGSAFACGIVGRFRLCAIGQTGRRKALRSQL